MKEGAETMGGIIHAKAAGSAVKGAGENRKGQCRAPPGGGRGREDGRIEGACGQYGLSVEW